MVLPEIDPLSVDVREKANLAAGNQMFAKRIWDQIAQLHELLHASGNSNAIEIGTQEDKIKWTLMPVPLEHIFHPEFKYQANEITRLYLQIKDDRQHNNEFNLVMTMDRNGAPWVIVEGGIIIRGGEEMIFTGITSFRCAAIQAQATDGRAYVEYLNHGFFSEPYQMFDDREMAQELGIQRRLLFTDSMVQYAETLAQPGTPQILRAG